jgi:hypothetical protein
LDPPDHFTTNPVWSIAKQPALENIRSLNKTSERGKHFFKCFQSPGWAGNQNPRFGRALSQNVNDIYLFLLLYVILFITYIYIYTCYGGVASARTRRIVRAAFTNPGGGAVAPLKSFPIALVANKPTNTTHAVGLGGRTLVLLLMCPEGG